MRRGPVSKPGASAFSFSKHMNFSSKAFKAALKKTMHDSAGDPTMTDFADEILIAGYFQPPLTRQQAADFCHATWHFGDRPGIQPSRTAPRRAAMRIQRLARLMAKGDDRNRPSVTRIRGLRELEVLVRELSPLEALVLTSIALLYREAPHGSRIEDFFRISDDPDCP